MNAKQFNDTYDIGVPVLVNLPERKPMITTTKSEAFEMLDGSPVVMVRGISGTCPLDRVTPVMVVEP
jgi:hypothetical protein